MIRSLILLAALLFASPLVAQTNINLGGITADASAPVEVAADNLTVDQDTGTATFTGNVQIGQGALRLSAGRVEVVYGSDTGEIARLQASNGVTFVTATEAAEAQPGTKVHVGGTYLCMEGPQFSTLQESELYRSWGVSVIGMTNMPECRLAREAELPYATLAMATDYDCWHPGHDAVTVESIIAVMQANARVAQRIVARLAEIVPDPSTSPAIGALGSAIMTDPAQISAAAKEKLRAPGCVPIGSDGAADIGAKALLPEIVSRGFIR